MTLASIALPQVCASETTGAKIADPIRYRVICKQNHSDPEILFDGISIHSLIPKYRFWYVGAPKEFWVQGMGWSASEQQILSGYLIDYKGRRAFAEARDADATGEVFSIFAREWDCEMLDSVQKGKVK